MKYGYIILFFCLLACNKKGKNSSGSLNFDGINDQLIVPNYDKLKLNNGTIEAWFKITKTDKKLWHSIVSKTLAYQITLRNYRASTYDWTTKEFVEYGDTLNDNKWHHMAFSFQNGVNNGSQLYLDGKQIGHPIKLTILNQGCEFFVGGNLFDEQFFGGNIDEVRVWNTVRTPKQVFENYATEINPYTSGLVLYYRFNKGLPFADNQQIKYVQDETSNELTGSLDKFNLKDSVSNYVKDSPLVEKKFVGIETFFHKYFWIIILVVAILILVYSTIKIKTSLLAKENKKLELLVQNRTKELDKSLKQKEILVQEIHHRVKNNLQFIISLIDFELRKKDNQHLAKDSLQNTSRRLTAIVLVHEMLYRRDDVETISINQYVEELVNTIKSVTNNNASEIAFTIEMDDCFLSVSQCTSIGIITSELITNSIKYAFKGINNPAIKIIFKLNSEQNEAEFIVADNGVGMNTDDIELPVGVGKKLIDIFCRQLDGEYYFKNDGGLVFKLIFPITKNV